ncbi:hypothetical protein Pcinc_039050 [Petrolisthes cinctipes]|uniref:Uncharacterized protein n=1 Tax=Petrolisthes cinctipes TaxID=88211 RepID=A0AAE1BP89_PETCI|nr:hypothetical protein Pcinc_039050 [Petrolisthes cinctipes]
MGKEKSPLTLTPFTPYPHSHSPLNSYPLLLTPFTPYTSSNPHSPITSYAPLPIHPSPLSPPLTPITPLPISKLPFTPHLLPSSTHPIHQSSPQNPNQHSPIISYISYPLSQLHSPSPPPQTPNQHSPIISTLLSPPHSPVTPPNS